MPSLFDPIRLGAIEAPDRILLAPLTRGHATRAHVPAPIMIELRAVKRHLAIRTDALPWLFLSERGQPLTRQAVNYLVGVAAERAGPRGPRHTLHYSRTAGRRFEGLWR